MFSYPLRFDGGALECPPAVLDQLSRAVMSNASNRRGRDHLVAFCHPSCRRSSPNAPDYLLPRCRLDGTDNCCDFMRTGASPYQTITVPMLGVLAIILPVVYVGLSVCLSNEGDCRVVHNIIHHTAS